jgi:GntR family transcriptional repressor for pyruvate dehydrogenase complex
MTPVRPAIRVERPAKASGGRRADQLVEALKGYIVGDRLRPGTRLPPERQLAEALSVSRNALREAIQSLAALGIVEQRHGSGVYVCDFNPDRLAEQFSYGLRDDVLYWRHLTDARTQIEVTIAGLAAQRITAAQLDHLRTLLETMRRQTGQEQTIVRADRAFHLAVAGCAANPVLERLAGSVISEHFRYGGALRLRHVLAANPVSIRNHEPLLAALTARDPAASVGAMRYHFRDLAGYADEALEHASR